MERSGLYGIIFALYLPASMFCSKETLTGKIVMHQEFSKTPEKRGAASLSLRGGLSRVCSVLRTVLPSLLLCVISMSVLVSWYAGAEQARRFPVSGKIAVPQDFRTRAESAPRQQTEAPERIAVKNSAPRTYAFDAPFAEVQGAGILRIVSGRVILRTQYGEKNIATWREGPVRAPLLLGNPQNRPPRLAAFGIFEKALCPVDAKENFMDNARANSLALRQTYYREYVENFSRRFSLSPALVYAVMRTESNFNPYAVSASNALGLMQVVPESAGGEAHAFLTGSRGVPDAGLLFSPEENIRYGAAYLHLLLSRHFNGVEDAASRELCAIAAYNGGPGAVLRVFDKDRGAAIAAINALSPGEVYQVLKTSMPTEESRRYVDKVLDAMYGAPVYAAHEGETAGGGAEQAVYSGHAVSAAHEAREDISPATTEGLNDSVQRLSRALETAGSAVKNFSGAFPKVPGHDELL